VYHPGCQHLERWAALDYLRQRELLPNGDYDRQRHGQQFIIAVLKQTASAGTLSDPVKLDRVVHQIGQGMTIDTNGISVLDLAFAFRNIKAQSLVSLKAPSHRK
jgi:polyisoprenyl-teichoic acid--peptidoglycan teichoic acid transferase